MHFNAQTMIQCFALKLILFFTFNEASQQKKTEAKKLYVSGLIVALNEVGLSSVKDCLACLEFCSFIVRFKEHQEMKQICEWVWPFFKCSQCDNNFRLFSFLTQKLELKSGFCFASLHPFSCSSFRKIGISVHPDISRSILVRPGSENHSGSEGWRQARSDAP